MIIVFMITNDAPGINLSDPSDPSDPSFPEMESSRAAPTLGSTRAGSHDDGS